MVQTCTVMTAPPCSSLRLSVFLMFCLTCECREDRLLFKTWMSTWRERRAFQMRPIPLSWSTPGGRQRQSLVESLGFGWRVSDSNESRGNWKLLGRFRSLGFWSLCRFIDFKLWRSPPAAALSSTSPPAPSLSWSYPESSKCGSLLSRRTGGTVVPWEVGLF